MKNQNFRFKCRNDKCGCEFLRRYNLEEFDKLQYGSNTGISCFSCGFPKMAVIRSNKHIKDGFEPGFQRNIRKYCATYSEYKAHLKAMGLIEMGYEDLPEDDDSDSFPFWDDETLKIAHDSGFEIGGVEAEAMKKDLL